MGRGQKEGKAGHKGTDEKSESDFDEEDVDKAFVSLQHQKQWVRETHACGQNLTKTEKHGTLGTCCGQNPESDEANKETE